MHYGHVRAHAHHAEAGSLLPGSTVGCAWVVFQGKISERLADDQAHLGWFTMDRACRTAAAFIGNNIQWQLHDDITSCGVGDDVLPQVLQGNFVIEVDDRFYQFLSEHLAMVMFTDILLKRAI